MCCTAARSHRLSMNTQAMTTEAELLDWVARDWPGARARKAVELGMAPETVCRMALEGGLMGARCCRRCRESPKRLMALIVERFGGDALCLHVPGEFIADEYANYLRSPARDIVSETIITEFNSRLPLLAIARTEVVEIGSLAHAKANSDRDR